MIMNAQIENMKREAKKLSRATSITHMQALEVLAVQNGYRTWGNYAQYIEASTQGIPLPITNSAAPHAADYTPQKLLENAFSRHLPHIAECRHLIISGPTSAGKTSLFNHIIKSIPATSKISAIEETRELLLREDTHLELISRTDFIRQDELAFAKALAKSPDILLVGEISTSNVELLCDVMTMPDGPVVATTLHTRTGMDARQAFSDRIDYRSSNRSGYMDRNAIPADIAMVQVAIDKDGTRHVSSIDRT